MAPTRSGWRALKTKTWFSADLRFGHADILDDRPYRTLDEMHEAIIASWNARVSPDDVAWLLGDVVSGDLDRTLPLLAQLHGHKYLIAGSLDMPFHGRRTDGRDRSLMDWADAYRTAGGFTGVVTGAAARGTGHAVRVPLLGGPLFGHPTVLVSYFPRTGGSDGPDPYAEYRPRSPKRGPRPWVVHGGAGTRWVVDAAERQINVGADVWDCAPVGADELAALIEDFEPGAAERQLDEMEAAGRVREAKR